MFSGVTVCVGYDDLFRIALTTNLDWFDDLTIATSPQDTKTQKLIEEVNNPKIRLHVTDAFYRDGAEFNKGLAIEECFQLLNYRSSKGWFLVHDADVVFPKASRHVTDFQLFPNMIQPGFMYGAHRKMLDDPRQYSPDLNWRTLRTWPDNVHAGYFQMFHESDPVLAKKPWYGTNWKTAGTCDSEFYYKWQEHKKKWLPFNVLHLGPNLTNWAGRVSERMDGLPVENAEEHAARHAFYVEQRRKKKSFCDPVSESLTPNAKTPKPKQ